MINNEEKMIDFSAEFLTQVPRRLNEKEFKLSSLSAEDADRLFQGFYDAYMASVGASWDRDTFNWKAAGWTFFGEVEGGVALRHQKSGLWKLNASYGMPIKVMRGLQEMMSKIGNEPIWGAATNDVVDMLTRATKGNFKKPGTLFVRIAFPYFKKAMGSDKGTVTNKGSIILDTPAGKMEKFFFANKAYYQELINNMDKYFPSSVPYPIRDTLIKLLKKLI